MPDPDPIDEAPGNGSELDASPEAKIGPATDELPDVVASPTGVNEQNAQDEDPGFDEERGEPVDLATVYDADVMAALEDWEPPEHLKNQPMASRLSSWTRTSAVGAAMAGLSIALRDIYENQKAHDAIVIEVDADGEPHDLPIRLMLDPDDPSGSLCIVRRDPPPPVV